MLPTGIPGPREVRQGVGEGVRLVFAVPGAAIEALRAVPELARAARGLADENGPLRQLDNAIVALAGLQDVVVALEKIGLLATALEKLANLEDELHTLGQLEDSLEKISGFATVLDEIAGPITQLAANTKTLPELAQVAQSLPELVEQVRGIERIVGHLDQSIDGIAPTLTKIAEFGDNLEAEIDDLGDSLAPISRLASRMPGSKKRAREREAEKAPAGPGDGDTASAG